MYGESDRLRKWQQRLDDCREIKPLFCAKQAAVGSFLAYMGVCFVCLGATYGTVIYLHCVNSIENRRTRRIPVDSPACATSSDAASS